MDFLGIGIQEVLLILVILLIFVGPDRLPEIARQLGKASRKLKEATRELTKEIEEMADEVKDVGREAKTEVEPNVGLAQDLKEISDDVNSLRNEAHPAVKSSGQGSMKSEKAGDQTRDSEKQAGIMETSEVPLDGEEFKDKDSK